MNLPSCEVFSEMIQGSEEWFRARAGRLTASRMKEILTPTGKLSEQSEKLARVLARESIMDDPLQFIGNKYTEWGQAHEDEARQKYSEIAGHEVSQVGFCRSLANPVIGCSPDGLVSGAEYCCYDKGLEIKCPAIDTLVEWALESDGEVPKDHLPQVHGSMIVTGLRRWDFIAYHPGAKPYLASAVWNDYTDKLAEAIEAFTVRYAEIRKQVRKAIKE